jgi:hypothetical protein
MNFPRSEIWPGPATSIAPRSFAGRMIAHYIIDLMASVCLVLAFGWFFEASASDQSLHDVLITQNDVYVAISRFTPGNLLTSYATTIDQMTRGLLFGFSPVEGFNAAVVQSFVTIGQLVLDIGLAAPATMIALYHETTGLAALIVLAGFAMAIGSVVAWLMAAKISFSRLLLASALSPIAVSVVFLALQGFMMLMLEAFFRFTSLAPYAVVCPVVCTLYWAAFPNADRGATLMLARTIGRGMHPSQT